MKQVIACLADSPQAGAICDYATWAAQRLDTDLSLLHVQAPTAGTIPEPDPSNSSWMAAPDAMLDDLGAQEQRQDLQAQHHGEHLLQAALARIRRQGYARVDTRQRWGVLVNSLLEIESDTRLFVLGRRRASQQPLRLLSPAQQVAAVRALHRPVLVVPSAYHPPARFMVAFDGSSTATHMVEMISRSPLLTGLECHLAMVGQTHAPALQQAVQTLALGGFTPQVCTLEGAVVPALIQHARTIQADLLVMGAYGHGRIRQWVLGSATTALLEQAPLPLLILR